MLPSTKRLSRSGFSRFLTLNGNKSVFNSIGTLKYKEAQTPQVSVVVSSKIEKRAVYRNKIRRRLYNIFSTYFSEHPETKHFILHVSKQAVALKYKDLKTLLYELLKKTTK